MKYKVTGAHRGTGARMSLEFEADSKAHAERKAAQAGMDVHRVADAQGGVGARSADSGAGGRRTGMRPVVKLVILLALAAAVWHFVVEPVLHAQRYRGRRTPAPYAPGLAGAAHRGRRPSRLSFG